MYLHSRAQYSYSVEPPFICIIDHNDGARSVTNDAERVIADLVADGFRVDEYVIIYQDSEGVWDRMLTADGAFLCFESVCELKSRRSASSMARRRIARQSEGRQWSVSQSPAAPISKGKGLKHDNEDDNH
ncbi:hypothetical protein OKW49_006311 [Paraburkholderia youngii]|uniref:hypothetical protein n=1 Tax=Paraburkholderia youngii TaxID=2782701 RepID=UPI003D20C195